MMLYYLLRVRDNTNIVPEYGAFGSLKKVNVFISEKCSVFGKQIVYNTDSSVIYIKRERIEQWQETV